MIKIKPEYILELGAKYGLTNEIVGFNDFEQLLILFSTKLYVEGFNDGYKTAKDHALLTTCDCWEV
jgi:hypothetical protein